MSDQIQKLADRYEKATGKKIFDDFPEVDCNKCEPYWNNQCDGTPLGLERPCKAFKATRRVDIPLEIKSLRTHLKWLNVALILIAISEIIHIVSGWF